MEPSCPVEGCKSAMYATMMEQSFEWVVQHGENPEHRMHFEDYVTSTEYLRPYFDWLVRLHEYEAQKEVSGGPMV